MKIVLDQDKIYGKQLKVMTLAEYNMITSRQMEEKMKAQKEKEFLKEARRMKKLQKKNSHNNGKTPGQIERERIISNQKRPSIH